MSELIPINIVIADRTYRIKIEKENEALIRGTVKLINDKIVEFKTTFAGKDMQDYVSMVLIWFATEQNKQGESWLEEKQIGEKLQSFEQLIKKVLK